jgi:O-antigen ligase
MIRYSLLWMFVSGVMAYAWRDWVKALCVLVLLLGVLERPDMPKQIFGIQGLNPFNLTLAGILAAWVSQALRERPRWDIPRSLTLLFALYLSVMALSTARMLIDPSYLVIWHSPDFEAYSRTGLIAEFLINSFKWLIPAVLLAYGCRDAERQRWLAVCVLGIFAVLAYLVIKQMPLGLLLDGDALQKRAVAVLQRRVGYHRVDLAWMFAGAAWAMLAARPMFSSALVRTALVGLSGVTALGLALTGGRTGYVAFCVVGLVMSVLKWRRNLFLLPPAIVLVVVLAPGIAERMLTGVGADDATAAHELTSGRALMWPFTLRKIAESPVLGHGRQAWVRTSLRLEVANITGERAGHPHNAYLEFALDNGLVGLAVLLSFFALVLANAVRLFRMRGHPLAEASGGMALALTLSYLVAALGAGTFYPTEGSVGMWCLIALATCVARETVAVTATAPAVALRSRPTWRRPGAVPQGWPARPAGGALRSHPRASHRLRQ